MNKLLTGALALTLFGGAATAASAQTYDHDRGNHGRTVYDSRDHRGDFHRGHSWRGERHSRLVCTVRHHHRVCYRQHW